MATRMTWPELRRCGEYRGRWVALDNCRYDAKTAQPVEGSVVDADEDLAELCSRMKSEDGRHCAIVFCAEQAEESEPVRAVLEPLPASTRLRAGRVVTH